MSAARKKHQPKGIYCLENSGWYGAKEEVSFHLDRYAKPELTHIRFSTLPHMVQMILLPFHYQVLICLLKI